MSDRPVRLRSGLGVSRMAGWQDGAAAGDAGLVARIARGDEDAVEAFYRAHADAVFRYLYLHLEENVEDAQDVTEETFVSAVSLAETFDGCCSALTWLCGIAKLRLADFYRRRNRLKRVPDSKRLELDEESVRALCDNHAGNGELDELVERIDAERLVEALLVRLGEDERDALVLHYADGLAVREVAEVLGRSSKAVESLLTRAKHKAKAAAARCGLVGGPHAR